MLSSLRPQPPLPQQPLPPAAVGSAPPRPTTTVAPTVAGANTAQPQLAVGQRRSLTLTKEQALEAQEMFRTANRVTRPEKALILGFMAGSRDNPCPHLGKSYGSLFLSDLTIVYLVCQATLLQSNYRRIKKTSCKMIRLTWPWWSKHISKWITPAASGEELKSTEDWKNHNRSLCTYDIERLLERTKFIYKGNREESFL